jgi:hypothetical protein
MCSHFVQLLEGKYPHQLQYADLKRRYTPEYLAEKGYFMRYDKDGTFCWFFHLGHCELACLDDYQRLVLLNDVRLHLPIALLSNYLSS